MLLLCSFLHLIMFGWLIVLLNPNDLSGHIISAKTLSMNVNLYVCKLNELIQSNNKSFGFLLTHCILLHHTCPPLS